MYKTFFVMKDTCILFQAPKATPCSSCASLRKQKKKLQRQLRGMESKLASNQSKWTETLQRITKEPELVSTG